MYLCVTHHTYCLPVRTFSCILISLSMPLTTAICSNTVPLSLDSEPSLPHLMNKVTAVIPNKFEMIGLQLGLSLAELQVIGPRCPTLEDCYRAFQEMFGVWKRRDSPPYTWRTVIDVLKTLSVGEVMLADQLTSWITGKSIDP